MTSPTPLNAEAEAYRKDLADWISQSQLQTDYVLDEKGNRIYSRNRIASHVEKLLQALGLSGLGFTMWRYCAYTLIDPDPPTDLYFIPIQIVSGQPQMIKDRRQHQVVPGWYSVARGPFELTPEFDCLLAGDTSKAHRV